MLDENDVIEIFAGIKVTKKLLDENYVLDIDRVTMDDLVNSYNIESTSIQPYYLVPNIDDLGLSGYDVYAIIPNGYQSVSVTKKGTVLSGTYAGETAYIVNLYLSNSALMYYIEECFIGDNVTEAVSSFIIEFTLTTVIGTFAPVTSTGISLALGFLEIYNLTVNQSFRNQLVTLRRAGSKAHVQISSVSKSVTEWTDTVYGYENSTRNGLKIESEVIAYKDE